MSYEMPIQLAQNRYFKELLNELEQYFVKNNDIFTMIKTYDYKANAKLSVSEILMVREGHREILDFIKEKVEDAKKKEQLNDTN